MSRPSPIWWKVFVSSGEVRGRAERDGGISLGDVSKIRCLEDCLELKDQYMLSRNMEQCGEKTQFQSGLMGELF